ncbi:M14 family zinc carboxypeptidase [Aequorivita marina]|uniref:M14 family zinc carboxypeptidase n=1 Tax=Aequorivita marina TaxID=3073654 RepID=UPI00287563F4|nr:M14 family zinc carboxypeptidase [Aequorivita sp. S2608]MDS1297655.1 M14 family zinc carboxypeptidase [Aequorivita sp. S2608]
MKIQSWYHENFENRLAGRYITLAHISKILDDYKTTYQISVAGHSEEGLPIPLLKIGNGPKVVLGWSQMHGNESTTTKAVFDFLKFLGQDDCFQSEIETFLNTYTFYLIPILNPDGAKRYTRENANGIDLNRDAVNLSQSESVCLRNVFQEVKPQLCLNLHDQRSIFGFDNGSPATVSFLSPAADKERSLTKARITAMEQIVKMNKMLQAIIPGQVGRYDDSFNMNCVGDTFQKMGVPTILFEAGHYLQDYKREQTRAFVFYALISLFDVFTKTPAVDYKMYFDIPENRKNYNDFVLKNAVLEGAVAPVNIAIQYVERLRGDNIELDAVVDKIGQFKNRFGHLEKNVNKAKILTNTDDKLTVGGNISEIYDKTNDLVVFSSHKLLL